LHPDTPPRPLPFRLWQAKKSWPSVRLPPLWATRPAAPLLIQPYPPHGAPPVAPRMRPHLCGRQRARFRFRWAHPSRWRHIFFAPLLVRSSPPPKLQSRAATTHRAGKGGNGDPGSPVWPAAARPARAVRRVPVLVLQEGAVHRQGQLQSSSQGPCSSPTSSSRCFVTAEHN
jgi:hypothetical protein